MAYQDPRKVISPKDGVRHLNVLYDGGEQTATCGPAEGFSFASLEYFENPVLGFRWNGSDTNPDVTKLGYPSVRQYATWCILPEIVYPAIYALIASLTKKAA
jgi:hypothetical protein